MEGVKNWPIAFDATLSESTGAPPKGSSRSDGNSLIVKGRRGWPTTTQSECATLHDQLEL